MNTTQFKNGIKQVSGQLIGLTLQLVSGNNAKPYRSLKEFGYAILNAEQQGLSIELSQAWTSDGTKQVSNFDQLIDLFNTTSVTAISFRTVYEPATFSQYLKHSFGTTE